VLARGESGFEKDRLSLSKSRGQMSQLDNTNLIGKTTSMAHEDSDFIGQNRPSSHTEAGRASNPFSMAGGETGGD